MLRTLLLTAALAIAFFSAESVGITAWFHPDFGRILLFFLFLGITTQSLIERGMGNNRALFVQFYLGTVVLRLLATMGFLFLFFRLGTPLFQRFILNVFVLYLFYAGFEFLAVRRTLRRFSE